jgi:predicted transposase/invertase (TIGR01784 family)
VPIENPLDAVFVVEKLRIGEKLTWDKLMEWWTENTSGFSNDHIDTLITWINHNYLKGEMTPETLEMLKNNPKKGDIVMKTFVDELVENGKREGEKRKALKIAEAMKAKGMDVNTISELTGLTVDDVLRL